MVLSAVGDALGWPTEFLREKPARKPPFSLPVRDFVGWQKLVGGRWWGYRDAIGPGEYSDDTQLTLAVARSISSSGEFNAPLFAYGELPLWLHYERGGGRSIKTAARSFTRKKVNWSHNFYKRGNVDYRMAGANGAAMRNLPISLVSVADENRLVRDSLYNALITHGHPRGILGTVISAYAIRHALTEDDDSSKRMVECLRHGIDEAGSAFRNNDTLVRWVRSWDKMTTADQGGFAVRFANTQKEANRYLQAISRYMDKVPKDYYRFVGALNPATKGSGLATTCAAIFLYIKGIGDPSECLVTAANQLGSDTDTIASFLGALIGAKNGTGIIPEMWWNQVQDRDYLLKTAQRLHAIAADESANQLETETSLKRQDAYLNILAWELGLHEMFWDAIDVEDSVVHPTLGKGIIRRKEVRQISRRDYIAKLIRISFDCGQTCVFHSRVKHNDEVMQSLAKSVDRALARDS